MSMRSCGKKNGNDDKYGNERVAAGFYFVRLNLDIYSVTSDSRNHIISAELVPSYLIYFAQDCSVVVVVGDNLMIEVDLGRSNNHSGWEVVGCCMPYEVVVVETSHLEILYLLHLSISLIVPMNEKREGTSKHTS